MVSAIIVADENWAVSVNGEIPFRCNDINQYYNALKHSDLPTTLVFGRNTYDSQEIWDAKDKLSNCYVVTHDPDSLGYYDNDWEFPISMKDIKKILLAHRFDDRQIIIVGGLSMFNQLFKYIQEIDLVKVYKTYKGDVKYMANLDHDPNWFLKDTSKMMITDYTQYRFCTYIRKGGK